MTAFEELLDTWDGETAVIRRDRETGGWIFICIHSTRRGPAGGGTRMKIYATPADGLEDAMRLSGAMSRKLAVAGLPFGGGKAVIAIPEIPTGQPRRELLLRYGELVASLGGTYCTSSDMNTDEADLDVIWERTKYVFGRSVATGGSGSPARPTALGVFHGIRASVAHLDGSDALQRRRILIQGAGGVGSQLADHLAEAGASILVADVDQARAQAVAGRVNGEVIHPDDVLHTDADVYAPCAVGGTLDIDTASRLRCAVVAGSANNQLAQPEAAEILSQRGILYAPDYVINAGGAIGVAGTEQLGWSQDQVNAALEKIGETLRHVYHLSEERSISTAAAAEAIAEERLSEPAARP
ncbi:MAG TPA: Glu/Leu/Phe/Val dehydrogenase dimerization domain-containing protein [Solirubrobacteraceae bacterium]|nr:Glu/Leu/Phe/Val dehydrogenase dimerization domain-containing protein [Solirubrobacteraceae bacterium]